MRFDLDLYINQRPFVADTHDFVVIRENTEGTYAGEGGFLRKGTPHEIATQGSVNTRHGVERCVRLEDLLADYLASEEESSPIDLAIEIVDGGSLKLVGVTISGTEAPDVAGNAAIRTSRYSMLISRWSHAWARAQPRLTVADPTPSAAAVSW